MRALLQLKWNAATSHALHAADEYTAEKWVPLVDAMAPKANLSETEKTNVLAYVKAGAKQ